jgi:hypothetical protein
VPRRYGGNKKRKTRGNKDGGRRFAFRRNNRNSWKDSERVHENRSRITGAFS